MGGVRHDQPIYAAFDLERFVLADRHEPRAEDLRIMTELLRCIMAVPEDATAPKLRQLIGRPLPSNGPERDVLVQILGYCGILRVPDHPGHFERFVPERDRDLPPHRFCGMGYPVAWWRGEFGLDREALAWWIPSVEV